MSHKKMGMSGTTCRRFILKQSINVTVKMGRTGGLGLRN